jgi:thiol-disulfide isomerase/thioredoxin
MSFLIAAVMFVGMLCTLDLILTLGVIKRLREHNETLSTMDGDSSAITVGEEIGEFAASTVDGTLLSRELLVGDTLVAFFAPDCAPCKEKLPKFVEYARTLPGGRDRVLTIVVGEAHNAASFVTELSPVAQVVVEDHDGALHSAFKANAYPLMLRVTPNGDGRLVVTTNHVVLDQATVAA